MNETTAQDLIQVEFELIIGLSAIIVTMVGYTLIRVWRIPSIDTKLDIATVEVSRHRDTLRHIDSRLHNHETRLTLLEKTPPCRHPEDRTKFVYPEIPSKDPES